MKITLMTALITPNVITSTTCQVNLIVNSRQPLIKDLKSTRLWDQWVASLKLIRPVNFFDPNIGQLEELEGHIWDILGPEDIAQVKANIRTIQATHGKGVNKNQLSKIWVVSEELASKAIDNNSQLCNYSAKNSLSQQSSTNNRMLRHRRINIFFFTDTLLAKKKRWLVEINTPNSTSVSKDS